MASPMQADTTPLPVLTLGPPPRPLRTPSPPCPLQLLLAPLSQPGACLPLVGPSGWVDIRLSQPIYPTGASTSGRQAATRWHCW